MKSLYALPVAALLALPAQAATTVTWADWVRLDDTTAEGTFAIGSQTITVTASSTSSFFAVDENGSVFLTGNAYTQGSVANSPLGEDLIQLGLGGRISFSFSDAVANIYFAFVSWNVTNQPSVANPATFSQNVTLDSNGSGYWGGGTTVVSGNVANFFSEAHGVLTVAGGGDFTMAHNTEFWHGFTLGITPVPVPASAPLLLGALGAVALMRRRKA